MPSWPLTGAASNSGQRPLRHPLLIPITHSGPLKASSNGTTEFCTSPARDLMSRAPWRLPRMRIRLSPYTGAVKMPCLFMWGGGIGNLDHGYISRSVARALTPGPVGILPCGVKIPRTCVINAGMAKAYSLRYQRDCEKRMFIWSGENGMKGRGETFHRFTRAVKTALAP